MSKRDKLEVERLTGVVAGLQESLAAADTSRRIGELLLGVADRPATKQELESFSETYPRWSITVGVRGGKVEKRFSTVVRRAEAETEREAYGRFADEFFDGKLEKIMGQSMAADYAHGGGEAQTDGHFFISLTGEPKNNLTAITVRDIQSVVEAHQYLDDQGSALSPEEYTEKFGW